MAYVPNCRCDVFVSFAHLDDVAIGKNPPWVSSFAGDLKKVLRMRLGVREDDGLHVYFTGHSSLETGINLESALLDNASSSAIFVAVTSPAYVADNSWTMRELDAFQRSTAGEGRVFAIEHSPLDSNDEYPATLRDLKRMAFWQKNQEREIPVTMATGSDVYLQTLLDLAEQIRKELKRMRQDLKPPPTAPLAPAAVKHPVVKHAADAQAPPPADSPIEAGKTILLAQSTDDLDEEREQIRRYVEQYGVKVLPETLYPQGGDAFTVALDADLARVDAYVQLVGPKPAKRPPDMPLGYDRLQFEHAVARGLPIMQWLRPDIDPATVVDREHAKLLSGENVMRIGLEAFKADVVKRLSKPPAPPPVPSLSPEQFIFINADGSDLKLAENLRAEFRNANLTAAIPILQGSSEDVRHDLEENIVECDALVMIYGETTPVWLRGQLRLYSKLKHRRKEPLKTLAIYVGPPESKPDIGMDLPEIRRIDYREAAPAESLRQLLAGIRQ
jgi:hypothetical protein